MEAAQIGQGMVYTLSKKEPCPRKEVLPSHWLIEAICLAHDLGHPPFGHGGEIALNCAMHEHGGFEGNGQTLRLLARLESHTPEVGLNLTRRSLLGVIKYPAFYKDLCQRQAPAPRQDWRAFSGQAWKPPKCLFDTERDILSWILEPFPSDDQQRFQEYNPSSMDTHGKTRHKSLDCSIMECADDIAYGVHDLEDAIALRLFTREDWNQYIEPKLNMAWARRWELSNIADRLFDPASGTGYQRKQAIGELVHALINEVAIREEEGFTTPLLRYRAYVQGDAGHLLKALQDAVYKRLITTQEVQTLEYRGQILVLSLFEALAADPKRLLPPAFVQQYKEAPSEDERMRVICDYIAGMTDEYATRIYERLFVPRQGSVFERL
jgi:dGTPase